MAKMIPAEVPPRTPQSERSIFDRLRLDPETAEWTVLHSLGLARTRVGPYGEIDFVVLIPGRGIVCVEVKGGLVSCQNGIWTTRNQQTGQRETLKRSPYLQAREGMFALKTAIEKKFGRHHPATSCPLSYAVIFPAVNAPPASPGEEPWETIDFEALRAPISRLLLRNIEGTRRKLPHTACADAASPEVLAAIRQFLRPDFDCVLSRASTIRHTEAQLVSLTEAQYVYLDMAMSNDRVLVTGAAGTGKTLLAIEFARREAARGRRIVLLCYNKVLADWLRQLVAADGVQGIRVGTFHSMLRRWIGAGSYAREFEVAAVDTDSKRLFTELLPLYGELALSEQGSCADTLIIDEAQDLLTPENLPVLNQIVTGGLAGGRWALFGDFTRQAIYHGDGELPNDDFTASLDTLCPGYVKVPLRINCRNTRPIGEETALLSGFDSLPYRLAQADGPAVDYRYWRRSNDAPGILSAVLKKLLDDGIAAEDIVVLSPSAFDKSAAAAVGEVNGIPLIDMRDIEGEPGRCIVFSTVHSFKGMESPVVVFCDVADITTDHQRALAYVGMSRARSLLIMVVSEAVRRVLPELTRRRLAEGWGFDS